MTFLLNLWSIYFVKLLPQASRSALHKASISGQYEAVKSLLENGEDVDQADTVNLVFVSFFQSSALSESVIHYFEAGLFKSRLILIQG